MADKILSWDYGLMKKLEWYRHGKLITYEDEEAKQVRVCKAKGKKSMVGRNIHYRWTRLSSHINPPASAPGNACKIVSVEWNTDGTWLIFGIMEIIYHWPSQWGSWARNSRGDHGWNVTGMGRLETSAERRTMSAKKSSKELSGDWELTAAPGDQQSATRSDSPISRDNDIWAKRY